LFQAENLKLLISTQGISVWMWENESPLHQMSDSKTRTPCSQKYCGFFFFEVVRLEGEFLREHGLITLSGTSHRASGGSPWLCALPWFRRTRRKI